MALTVEYQHVLEGAQIGSFSVSRNNKRFSESANTLFVDGVQTGIISGAPSSCGFWSFVLTSLKYLRTGDTVPFFRASCDVNDGNDVAAWVGV